MGPLELLCAFRPEYLHHEQYYISDVAFHQLINEGRPLDLLKDWINLVGLRTHIFKYVVDIPCIQHLSILYSFLI